MVNILRDTYARSRHLTGQQKQRVQDIFKHYSSWLRDGLDKIEATPTQKEMLKPVRCEASLKHFEKPSFCVHLFFNLKKRQLDFVCVCGGPCFLLFLF